MPKDSNAVRHGAEESDWTHWDMILGLTEDLLPVVSNTAARISDRSSLKTLGKTPSLYNGRREVIGIPKWTEKRATGGEVDTWSREPDLGICLQTRRMRAIDIDVPDPAVSLAIVAFISSFLNVDLPRRFRADSGKCLLLFDLPGDYRKGVMKVDGGIVEFLAGGNQCVVAGAHSGGARYEWEGGLPVGVPVVDGETFEALWAALEAQWALEPSTRLRTVSRGEDIGLEDAEAGWLVENWETYGLDRAGRRLFVACPWKAEHSVDSGETEAAWLMRGTGGKERGHYRCLHGSCDKRGREDFLGAVGYVESGFADLTVGEPAHAEDGGSAGVLGRNGVDLPLPGFKRNLRTGVIFASVTNLLRACTYPEVCGYELAYDTFRDSLMVCKDGDEWRPLEDTDVTEIRSLLEGRDFETPPKEMMRDAIRNTANKNKFDSAIQWLEGLPAWDGAERCAPFMSECMGASDTAYSRAVGLYAWTAHAARVMDPGCKVDMVVALTGPQGQDKSGAIAAIAPQRTFFKEIGLHRIDANLSRKLRGLLVAEISELRGLNSTDAETIRAWITQREENWTPKFIEHETTFQRRMVLWSTTNEEEFLGDSTGERRWLPCEVERDCRPDLIERDREQLWAEGLARWRSGGVAWRDAMNLAKQEHARFKIGDVWTDRIAAWLDEPDIAGVTPRGGDGFKLETLAIDVCGLDFARFGKREEMRIGKILRALGVQRVIKRVEGRLQRVWTTV